MRFEGIKGSRVDVEAAGVGAVVVSVTEQTAGHDARVTVAVLDANHAEALALGLNAAVKELHARAVSP